jgi:hypothetical protein
MDQRPNRYKNIHWNGIHLRLPFTWETIFSGKNHLVFENDLQPTLELRWTNNNNQSPEKRKKALIKRLRRELQTPVKEISPPIGDDDLPDFFECTWLSWRNDHIVTGAILSCLKCQTLFLIRFHQFDGTISKIISPLLASIRCHGTTHDKTLWTIQDLRFKIPANYTLQNYNVAAGFTRLSFSAPGSLAHVCRLATASERLKVHNMEMMLSTLLGNPLPEERLSTHSTSVLYQCSPSILSQIFIRLKRHKPFCWAKIWHDITNDRLLVLMVESIRPIDEFEVQQISDSYEIIQPNS